jgi:hypothetical protein
MVLATVLKIATFGRFITSSILIQPNGFHFRQIKTTDRSYIGASLMAFSQEGTVDVQAIVQLGRSRPQRVLSSSSVCRGSVGQQQLGDMWQCPYESGDFDSSPKANAIAWVVMSS